MTSARLTVDLDVAAPFTAENLERLFDAIRPHRPVHATRPDLSVLDEPIERLTRFRLLLIDTALGRLDVLREVTPIGECADLDTIEMEVLGQRVRVSRGGRRARSARRSGGLTTSERDDAR